MIIFCLSFQSLRFKDDDIRNPLQSCSFFTNNEKPAIFCKTFRSKQTNTKDITFRKPVFLSPFQIFIILIWTQNARLILIMFSSRKQHTYFLKIDPQEEVYPNREKKDTDFHNYVNNIQKLSNYYYLLLFKDIVLNLRPFDQ